jgi:hypothetical protein
LYKKRIPSQDIRFGKATAVFMNWIAASSSALSRYLSHRLRTTVDWLSMVNPVFRNQFRLHVDPAVGERKSFLSRLKQHLALGNKKIVDKPY